MVNSGLFVVPNFVVLQSAVSTAGAADTTTPASNVGLIALLPLVGAVVGGVVGGVIGALANSVVRNRELKKVRKEEREGLLILLSEEVHTHTRILETFLKELVPPDDNRANVAASVRSAVWDESRVRLAQLIPGRFISMLSAYYTRIEILRLEWTAPIGVWSEDDTSEDDAFEDDKQRARDIRGNGFMLIREAQVYISDPDFTAPMLKDEDIV